MQIKLGDEGKQREGHTNKIMLPLFTERIGKITCLGCQILLLYVIRSHMLLILVLKVVDRCEQTLYELCKAVIPTNPNFLDQLITSL